MLHLSIFLSSPGDVAEERQLARDAIAELQREPQFEGVRLEAVSWDDPHGRTPLVAQLDPQTAVERGLPKPSECDVVVGIFWARMGSPLPADKYIKADGGQYLSGTEYELEDAFGANPGPDVLLYRRGEEPRWGARDPGRQEKQEQLERLDAYLELLKAVPRYIDTYATPSVLKERLKADLRKVLAPRLRERRPFVANETLKDADPNKYNADAYLVYQIAFLWYGKEPPNLYEFRRYMTAEMANLWNEIHTAINNGQLAAEVTHAAKRIGIRPLRYWAHARGLKSAFLFRDDETTDA